LEEHPEPPRQSLIGQISDRRREDTALPPTPIFLLSGKRLVASTTSNEFGEFQFGCKLNHKMMISFPFDGSRIDVPLGGLSSRESDWK
jgi:hypothetical protein